MFANFWAREYCFAIWTALATPLGQFYVAANSRERIACCVAMSLVWRFCCSVNLFGMGRNICHLLVKELGMVVSYNISSVGAYQFEEWARVAGYATGCAFGAGEVV
jgi:hypothetical protein